MTEEQCIIHKVSVEVNAHTSMDTDTLQKKVHQLIEESILQCIDEYLSKKSESLRGQSVRIDTLDLELDFGSVDNITQLDADRMIERQLDRFFYALNLPEASARLHEQEPTWTVQTSLSKTEQSQKQNAPDERLAGTSSNGKPVELLSSVERKMETLLHFLLEGTTPWWVSSSEEMSSIVQDEKLIELLQNSVVFRFQFRQYLKRPRFFERFVAQFAPTTIARVLLYLAQEKWTDMVGFQKSFLAPLERLRRFTRAERSRFWINFHKATAIQSYAHWKEKVVLESHRGFAERSNEPGNLIPALAKMELDAASEIAVLTVFMLEYKGSKTIDFTGLWTELLNELDENAKDLLLSSPQRSSAISEKRTGKKDASLNENLSTAQKKTGDSLEENAISEAEESGKSSSENTRDADLAQRFENYRKRMEARLKQQKAKKGKGKNGDEDASERDPDDVWDEFLSEDAAENEAQESRDTETQDSGKGWVAGQVGLLLIHPFLKAFCARWELLNEDQQLKRPEEMAHILHFIATGREQESEFELSFEKFLCGLESDAVLDKDFTLPDEMKNNIDELLQSAIAHWTALKGTSIAGLRSGFLMRPGKIVTEDSRILLTVERHAIDILIDRLPWTISYLKVPWRKEIIHITW